MIVDTNSKPNKYTGVGYEITEPATKQLNISTSILLTSKPIQIAIGMLEHFSKCLMVMAHQNKHSLMLYFFSVNSPKYPKSDV